jgi:hypothetical protein
MMVFCHSSSGQTRWKVRCRYCRTIYDRVLKAIRQVEGLGRIQDELCPNQVEVLLMVLPNRGANN